MLGSEVPFTRPLPPNLTRFNYWTFAIINPLEAANEEQVALLVHPSLSSRFQTRFEAGEHEAIFEYAGEDPLALRAAWVAEEVASWRLQGGTANRKKFQKFIRAYWTERGRRKPETVIEDIERDQEVFRAIMNRQPVGQESLVACMRNVAREKRMGLESVKELHKEYRAEMRYRLGTMTRTPEVRELLEEIGQEVSRRRRKEIGPPRDPKKWLKDLKNFYLYLDQCLENLKRYCRGERSIRLELESPLAESREGKRRPRTTPGAK
jgi:hypothetical protein